jgi:hypothetical protein
VEALALPFSLGALIRESDEVPAFLKEARISLADGGIGFDSLIGFKVPFPLNKDGKLSGLESETSFSARGGIAVYSSNKTSFSTLDTTPRGGLQMKRVVM